MRLNVSVALCILAFDSNYKYAYTGIFWVSNICFHRYLFGIENDVLLTEYQYQFALDNHQKYAFTGVSFDYHKRSFDNSSVVFLSSDTLGPMFLAN